MLRPKQKTLIAKLRNFTLKKKNKIRYYLWKVTHFQIETDDEDVPGDPQHQPDCILWKRQEEGVWNTYFNLRPPNN